MKKREKKRSNITDKKKLQHKDATEVDMNNLNFGKSLRKSQ
jgi:hypothetical protein